MKMNANNSSRSVAFDRCHRAASAREPAGIRLVATPDACQVAVKASGCAVHAHHEDSRAVIPAFALAIRCVTGILAPARAGAAGLSSLGAVPLCGDRISRGVVSVVMTW